MRNNRLVCNINHNYNCVTKIVLSYALIIVIITIDENYRKKYFAH